MYDFKKMTVEELRAELVSKYGYSEDMANELKGKASVVAAIESELANDDIIESASKALDSVTVDEEDEAAMKTTITDVAPLKSSPEWNDYVMTHFVKDELVDKNPTVDGLRRVAELLLGDIIESTSDIIQVPTEENKGRATVKHRITIEDGDSKILIADGSADVFWGNCDKIYRNHPVAVAETRAEGRALRKLLRLRKVLSAEEAAKDLPNINGGSYEVNPMFVTDNQIRFYGVMCKKLNINIQKLINKHHPDVHNINELSYDESLSLQALVSSYQNGAEQISEDLIGYDESWETTFRSQT